MKQKTRSTERVDKPHDRNSEGNHGSPKTEPRKSSWEFYFIMAVIAVGILTLIAKAVGLF